MVGAMRGESTNNTRTEIQAVYLFFSSRRILHFYSFSFFVTLKDNSNNNKLTHNKK
jgi:hypothetical protein